MLPEEPLIRPLGNAARSRVDEPAARYRRRFLALTPGRFLRPRRRGHAEPHDEVEVQADQAEDRTRKQEHVDRVEADERRGPDLGAAAEEARQVRTQTRAR